MARNRVIAAEPEFLYKPETDWPKTLTLIENWLKFENKKKEKMSRKVENKCDESR